jgi:hypothetical protein
MRQLPERMVVAMAAKLGSSGMKKALLALGVAAAAITATPAAARHHYSQVMKCTKYRHGRCVTWHRLTRGAAMRHAYRVGYAFGPNYDYTAYGALPGTIVTRYHLRPTYRYVSADGYVYVVNPRTYRVVRIIPML